MEKISLKKLNLREVETLSREQLKNVLGGWSDGSGTAEETNCERTCSGKNVLDPCVTSTCASGFCANIIINGTTIIACHEA